MSQMRFSINGGFLHLWVSIHLRTCWASKPGFNSICSLELCLRIATHILSPSLKLFLHSFSCGLHFSTFPVCLHRRQPTFISLNWLLTFVFAINQQEKRVATQLSNCLAIFCQVLYVETRGTSDKEGTVLEMNGASIADHSLWEIKGQDLQKVGKLNCFWLEKLESMDSMASLTVDTIHWILPISVSIISSWNTRGNCKTHLEKGSHLCVL